MLARNAHRNTKTVAVSYQTSNLRRDRRVHCLGCVMVHVVIVEGGGGGIASSSSTRWQKKEVE